MLLGSLESIFAIFDKHFVMLDCKVEIVSFLCSYRPNGYLVRRKIVLGRLSPENKPWIDGSLIVIGTQSCS
jgi:hypothetical protein